MFLVLPNYIFTYNGNQYVRVTPYSMRAPGHAEFPLYIFSDGSQIGQVKAANGNSSNYRFFEIQPIKWIVLNYNYLPSQYGTGGDGTHTRLELLANDVLVGGAAPTKPLWKDSMVNIYLNGTFNKEAFPRTILTTSTISNNTNDLDIDSPASGSNSNYPTSGSNQTNQALYLLSNYEMANSNSPYITNEIFGTNKVPDSGKRIVAASDYAKAHYQLINSTTGKSSWWLRTTANSSNVYGIGTGGGISYTTPDNTQLGTRPAMQKQKSRN